MSFISPPKPPTPNKNGIQGSRILAVCSLMYYQRAHKLRLKTNYYLLLNDHLLTVKTSTDDREFNGNLWTNRRSLQCALLCRCEASRRAGTGRRGRDLSVVRIVGTQRRHAAVKPEQQRAHCYTPGVIPTPAGPVTAVQEHTWLPKLGGFVNVPQTVKECLA